jgi:hypothetical protein
MPKLSLNAAPTFSAPVAIPIAGGDPVSVKFTFKHRTKKQLEEFIQSRQGKPDVDSFLDMVSGWDLEDAFSNESVELLLENYIGAAAVTYRTYIDELFQVKQKN